MLHVRISQHNIIKWFLDRPSHDLKDEIEAGTDLQLKEGSTVRRSSTLRLGSGCRDVTSHTASWWQVLELGCGDGRDSLYLGSLGHSVTGVDVGARAIEIAQQKASERGLTEQVQSILHTISVYYCVLQVTFRSRLIWFQVEFLAYDALQLPEPITPVDFIYDNTVYCNLRLEYLEKVLAMLDRITTPGEFNVAALFWLPCLIRYRCWNAFRAHDIHAQLW